MEPIRSEIMIEWIFFIDLAQLEIMMNYLSSAHEFSTRFFLSGLPRGTKGMMLIHLFTHLLF